MEEKALEDSRNFIWSGNYRLNSRITEEVEVMAEGERATGTPNTVYDLSSVLFHALEGGASYDTYIKDAEREGDEELAEFFRQVRDEDSNRADRAQQLLAERTTTTAERTEGTTTGAVAGTGEGSPGRAQRVDPLGREDPLPREDRAPLGREDPLPREDRAPLGREDPLPREQREPLGREDRLPREQREPLGKGDPLPREDEARKAEREEDKGLLEKALDKLSGRGDEERRER